MTLEELYNQLGQVLKAHPEKADDEAKFMNGGDILWEDDPGHKADIDGPAIHSGDIDMETIDGLTKVFDSDADEWVWIFHS